LYNLECNLEISNSETKSENCISDYTIKNKILTSRQSETSKLHSKLYNLGDNWRQNLKF